MRAFALVTKQITTRSIFKQILENTKELVICYPLKKELPFGAEREKSNFQSENEKSFQISPSRSTSQLSDPIFSISNLTQPLQGWQMNGPFIGAPIQLRSRYTSFLLDPFRKSYILMFPSYIPPVERWRGECHKLSFGGF